MIRQLLRSLGPAFAWLAFPLVPALLGRTYHDMLGKSFLLPGGPDPRDWSWPHWAFLGGPLLGYGFLAGATLDLPDDPGRRGVRGWLSRRAVWVGVGPWAGWLVCGGLSLLWGWMGDLVRRIFPGVAGWSVPMPENWAATWWGGVLAWALFLGIGGVLGYGWIVVAWAAIRRAKGLGRARRAIERGVGAALTFTGSLFGSFWAITEVWRAYFFDMREYLPVALAALTLALISGCSSPLTYGEVRRRELFGSMLMAWLLGLALTWRWWSRPRAKP